MNLASRERERPECAGLADAHSGRSRSRLAIYDLFDVPKIDKLIQAPGCQVLAVGAEGEARDGAGVGDDRAQLGAAVGVPDLDLLVVAAACQLLAVAGESHRPDAVVRSEGAQLFLAGDVEDFDGAIQAGRGQARAVRAEGQA